MGLSYKPSTFVIEQLKELQARLALTFIDLQKLDKEEKDFIHRQALISNIGASTRIENALLTDVEVEWVDTKLGEDSRPTAFDKYKKLILNKFSKDKERSVEEVVGCREMLELIYSNFSDLKPFREVDLRALHNHLLKHYPAASHYSGKYKAVTNQVIMVNHETGERNIVLDPASPGPITEAAMRDLIEWYNHTIQDEPWAVLVASEFVFRFLAIHPFQDGNGRLSRGLFLLCLLQSEDKYLNEVAKYIAFDRHIEQERAQYYLALRQCSSGKFYQDSRKYKLEPIVNFFIKTLMSALEDIQFYKNKFSNLRNLTDLEKIIIDEFKSSPEKKLRVSDIEQASKLNKRTIQKAIQRLIKVGFLQKSGRGPQIRYQLVF